MQKNKEKITAVQIVPFYVRHGKLSKHQKSHFLFDVSGASQLHCHWDELRSKKGKEVLIFRDFLDGVARCHKQFYLLFQGAGVEWKKSAERFQFVIIIVHS